jgi:hypothetical protein
MGGRTSPWSSFPLQSILLLLFSILASWGRGRSREEEEMVGGCHGRRGGGQPREKWGGWRLREGGGGKRGSHLGFCGRKEPTPQMTSAFASNGPQLFPTSTHCRSTFGPKMFLGYYTLPPLKRIRPRIQPLQAKHPRYPITTIQNMGPLLVLINTRTSTLD